MIWIAKNNSNADEVKSCEDDVTDRIDFTLDGETNTTLSDTNGHTKKRLTI